MFVAAVALFMLTLPVASVIVDAAASTDPPGFVELVGKWFVFWAVGVRLLTAGIRQVARPRLTAEGILGIRDSSAWILVRELGFANIATGAVAIASLWHEEWRTAAALAGGAFLLAAGALHLAKAERDSDENLAMVSDLAIGLVMAAFLVSRF